MDTLRGFVRNAGSKAFHANATHPANLETKKENNRADDRAAVSTASVDLLVNLSGVKLLPVFWRNMSKRRGWKRAFDNTFGLSVRSFYAEYSARKGN